MKKVFAHLIGIAACVIFASCEKETILTVNQALLSFNNGGGSQTVNIVANKVWSASSNQSWCKVSPSSGDGSDNSNITISVSCDANASYDARTCTITINCEELTETIAVSQAEGKGLILSQTEFNLTNDAQIISVEVQANVQYTVEIDNACKSWIKQESTKALSSNIIKFAISKNEDYDVREGKITIKQTDGSLSGSVVINQSQQNGLFVSTSEYSLSNEKHTLTVEVKANVEFEVKSNVDWIKHVETKGLKTSQIVLEVAANEEYDDRVGTVEVKQKNGDLNGIITIHQEENYGILVSQSEYSISNEAQTIEVEVKYNVEYDVVIPSGCKDWISVVSTKGLSSRNYTISIAKNETYDNREGSITFKQKNGSLSGTIKIYQSQTDGIIAEKKEYVVSAEEQQLSIKVASNVEYEVVIDDGCKEWLKQIQTKGLTEETLLFQVEKNAGGDRNGKVIFRNKHIQEGVTVKQEAEGIVEFKDAYFKAYCVKNFDKNGDGEISYDEALKVSEIFCSFKTINSLSGIEFFRNLTLLDCTGNQLTSIDLSSNTTLLELDCNGNQLTSIDLSSNTALVRLVCGGNQLTSLDLSNNTALKDLFCSGGQLTSIDLNNNTKLESLSFYNTPLESLDVSNNSALMSLTCLNNELTSLDVSNNPALKELICEGNKLASLNVNNNPELIVLYCGNNQLTNLDVSKNTKLEALGCNDNQLTSLDISKHTALQYLECSGNTLKSLNLKNNTILETLGCEKNQLTNLDVSKNTALIRLFCNNNQLKSLDVSTNTKLEELGCENNQLTFIDINNNTYISRFECADNQLTNIDVSKNMALMLLNCSNNRLNHLEVSKNAAIKELKCFGNCLKSLDVSNNALLNSLDCTSNPYLTEIWLKAGQIINYFHYDTNIATIKYK